MSELFAMPMHSIHRNAAHATGRLHRGCLLRLLTLGLVPTAHLAWAEEPAPIAEGVSSFVAKLRQGELRCAASDAAFKCLGIPYAQPPLGDLRFKAPQAPSAWEGARDGTQFASTCLQPKTDYSKVQEGSEDCLYLNVYSPKTLSQAIQNPLPVMVWLHGGGFVNGSGNAFNGEYLAKTANAIIVTVNYRLGPFGWLALPGLAKEAADGSTGNYGLLDSLAALTWVHDNIQTLGGDSQRVTLFGQSAGGEQTLALMASPYAKGLFQRAIAMSAPATLQMPTIEAAAAKRKDYLRELGCTDPATQPACLRALPAQKLLDAAHISWDLIALLGLQWTPTMDGAVLPDQWIKRYRAGDINAVPIIVGHTRDEGRLFTAIHENVIGGPLTNAIVDERGKAFFGPVALAASQVYSQKEFPVPTDRFARTISDLLFTAGLETNRAALAQHTKVYGYQSCDQDAAPSHVVAKFSKLGCAHDSDLPYLFQWDDFTLEQPRFNADQQALAVAMGRYFGQFAATGDPNIAELPAWPMQTPNDAPVQLLETASMGGVRTVAAKEFASYHRLSFWHKLGFVKRNLVVLSAGLAIALCLIGYLAFRKKKHV